MKRFAQLLLAAPLLGVLLNLPTEATVPTQPSIVTVSGRQLMVQKRQPDGSLTAATPYVIKGIDWNPATAAPAMGPDPGLGGQLVPYGFFFDDTPSNPWRSPGLEGHVLLQYWLKSQIQAQYATDIPLMAQMNVNTVRVYSDFGTDPSVYQQVLDTFYNNGIMVIMTVIASSTDITSGQYLATVAICKNHPAILMWSIGNEWNFNNLYGYPDAPTTTSAVNQAAAQIKASDPNHPVTSSLGDEFALGTGPCGPTPTGSDIPTIVNGAPNVDLWGLNVYRGASFGTLFSQWQAASSKPFYLSEFGTDSFMTSPTGYTLPFAACTSQANEAQVKAGAENQAVQASFDAGLWSQIAGNLSASNSAQVCAGGVVFEFNDEIWKDGDYNVGLGGLAGLTSNDTSYAYYNMDGFYVPGGHPDNVANEEYFGIVNANRNPKQAFQSLQTLFAPTPVITSSTTATAVVGSSITYTITATNNPTSFNAAGLPAGLSVSTMTGIISGVPTVTGISTVTISASNAGGVGTAELIMTVSGTSVISAVSVTPSSGSGFSQTFQFLYTDTHGAGDLSFTSMLFTPQFSTWVSTNSCELSYSIQTNELSLMNDNGSDWLIMRVGETGLLQNSRCSVNMAGVSVTPNGNALTVSLPLTFTPGFAGTQQIWSSADNLTINSGWQQMGSWTVPAPVPSTPTITSPLTMTGQVGQPFTYQITGNMNLFGYYVSSVLPPGLSFNSSTGLISGTPTQAGVWDVFLGAANSNGVYFNATVQMTINQTAQLLQIIQSGLSSAWDLTIDAETSPLPAGTQTVDLVVITNEPASCVLTNTNTPVPLISNNTYGININNLSNGLGFPTPQSYTVSCSTSNVTTSASFNLQVYCPQGQMPNGSGGCQIPPLQITSSLNQSVQVGQPFNYQITVASSSPTSFGATGLAPGLSINTSTGVISGIPTMIGTTNITISATDSAGTGTAILVLTVSGTPVITSSPTLTGQLAQPCTYQITTDINATGYYVSSVLPPGLSFNESTGLISGTPIQGGVWYVFVGADYANGYAQTTVQMTINGLSSSGLSVTQSTSTALSSIRIYPNPWRAARGDGDIIFDQMPLGSTVKIFTVSGRWVKTLDAPAGKVPWDLTNDAGDKVASGIYFYLITDGQGDKMHGKFTIIR